MFKACRGVVFLLLIGCLSTVSWADSISLEQLRKDRQQAAQRQRRIIFNNDGNEPIYLCKDTTPEELLSHRTSPLAGTNVDTIFYCTWSSGFGMFTHGTKVGHVFNTKEDLFSKNMIDEMLAAGTDPLRVMADFTKKNNMELFWSFRMNDTHDGWNSSYGPVMFRANPLKQKHPEWLLGETDQRLKHGRWSAVDYTQPAIRDLAVKYVEEVCQNYDVDGIELDFFRHPVFFKRAAHTGTPCNDEEREMMNDMLRKIRKVTETEGLKRNRPILLAVRVPDSVEYSRDVGLDFSAWMKEGLIDLLVVSGYYQLNDWEYSVQLGREHGIPVYPSLDESRVRDPDAKKLRSSTSAYRGRALTAWQAGAAGMYLFNSFNPRAAIWKELGTPEILMKQDQDYFASIRGVGAAAGGALPHQPYQQVPTLNAHSALPISAGKPAQVTFPFACDLTGLDAGKQPKLTLHLQFDQHLEVNKAETQQLTVKLNGTVLDSPKSTGQSVEFVLNPEWLKLGKNSVEFEVSRDSKPLRLLDLRCSVRW